MEHRELSGAALAKAMKHRHLSTNWISIPIVVMYTLYAMSGGLQTLLHNSSKGQVIYLCVAILIPVLFAVWVHAALNKKDLKDAVEILDNTQRYEKESTSEYSARAKKGVDCLLKFPLRSAAYSLASWPSTITVILIITYLFIFQYPASLMALMLVGSVSGGILVAVFQYHLFKQGAAPFLHEILKCYPQYWKEPEYFQVKHGLRKKMLYSFICLMIVMMNMTSVLLYLDATKAVQTEWATGQKERISRELENYGSQLVNAADEQTRIKIVEEMDIRSEGASIYFIDSKANLLIPANVNEVEYEILQRMCGLKNTFDVGKDKAILTEVAGHKNQYFNLEPGDMKVSIRIDIPNSDQMIILRRSFRTFIPQMYRIISVSILLGLMALLVSIVFTHFASKDVTDTVNELVIEVEKVSRGELSQSLNVITYDEVGMLALHLKKMIENLRSMMNQITTASNQVEGATVRIVDGFKRVSDGSKSQSSAVDETSAAMDQMNASIKGIGENVETLASTAQESSASIIEMSATIEEVADNVENLASSVEQTTSSISEMAASVRQVAENVENLSRKAESTVTSVTQMEVSIKEVQGGAEETAKLSEMVAKDADTGAQKVQNTIKGIGHAREDSELAVRVIHELANRAEEIGNILTVIDDITDETNLLALNAAIIAAQAGEHGRGFSVVADEIKDLAERTAQSTQEIAQQIEAVQEEARQAVEAVSRGYDAVEQGVKLSKEAGEALNKILDSAKRSTSRTRDIAKATVEQAQRTREVLQFFEEISDSIHQVEVATREQSKGSDQIQKTAERMREIAKIVKKATQEQFLGSKQITQAMENINHIVAFINSSQQEQIKNTDQVVNAIQEIRAIASQNDDGVEEMFQASANLSSLAEELRSMVEAFKIDTK